MNTSASSSEAGAYGAIPLINYLYDTDNINYINKNSIHIVGHSAGGNSTMTAGVYFSNLAGGVFENCKVKSIYISGYIRNIIDVEYAYDGNGDYLKDENDHYVFESIDWEGSKVANLDINVGFVYCEDDEGAWQNINFTGDITRPDSIESLALITSGGVHTELRKTGIEEGKVYGQPSDGTMKVGYQEHTLHGVQPFDVKATSHILYYLDYVTMANSSISPNNQIWYWKQFAQLVITFGLFMAIIPMAGLLVKIPFFEDVIILPKRKEGEEIPTTNENGEKLTVEEIIRNSKPNRPKSPVNWILWAITFLIGASVACFSFVPLADLSKVWFPDAAAHKVTWFFPARMNNAVMLWAALNGTLGIVLFLLTWFINGRRTGEKFSEFNLHIGWKSALKTILVSILVWGGFYLLVQAIGFFFNMDARFTFVAIRGINKYYIVYTLMYLPFFFIYYFSLSLRINNSSITENKSKHQWINYAISVLMNTFGLAMIFAIQYLSIADHGLMFWTTDWLFTNMLWILIPLMFILPIIQKKIYKHTNNVYLAAIITCLIFITISMANGVAHGFFNF